MQTIYTLVNKPVFYSMINSNVKFRLLEEGDLEQVVEIYNQGIDASMSSFDDKKVTIEKFRYLLSGKKERLIVASIDHLIIGWSSIKSYLRGSTQQFTCYGGTYVRKEYRGRHLGQELLLQKFNFAKQMGYKSVIAEVFTKNEASIAMCLKQGYKKVGIIHQVTKQNGIWLDSQIFQKML